MGLRWKVSGSVVCVILGLLAPVVFSGPASATPTVICTWTGASNTDLSIANNWSPNTGQSCGGTSTTVGSALLSGAELVFPGTVPASGSSLTLGAPESVDDLVFNNGYVIGGSNTLTLTPSANSSLGIDVASGGTTTITVPVSLGQSQTFVAASGQYLYLEGAIASSTYGLTIGNALNTGTVDFTTNNTYVGGTTVADGILQIGTSGSLGTGSVTVSSGASLLADKSGGTAVNPANALTLSGTGAFGTVGALEDYSNGDGWSGPITLSGGATIGGESASVPFNITGAIGGSGPLTIGGGIAVLYSGSNNYSGGTTISQGTLKNGVAKALPSTSSLAVSSGATYDLNSYSQTVAGLTGSGSVKSSSGTPTLSVYVGASSTDTVNDVLSGPLTLRSSGPGTMILSPTGGTNSYSGPTLVTAGTLRNGVANAIPQNNALNVSSGALYDLAGNNEKLSSLIGSGSVTSSSGTPVLYLNVGASSTDTDPGSLTGSLVLNCVGSGTLVLSSSGNTYVGTTTVTSGVLDVTGTITASTVTVDTGATLEGTGTVEGIGPGAGVVHPGQSPGVLTSSGGVTLGSGGSGTLAIDIVGSAPGSGYSQLSASGQSVSLSGANLVVTDSFAAGYGTIYTIIQAASISGTFANVAWGSVITSNGFKLQIGHTATSVVLTDVTNPPVSLGPTTPPPPVGAISYSGGISDIPSGHITVTNDHVAVTAYGEGGLMVAQLRSNPVGPPNFESTNEYFQVRLSYGNLFSSVTIQDCNLNGGTILEWWNPEVNTGFGGWQPVSPSATYIPGPPPCLSVTLDNSTTPSLAQLADAIFAVGGQAPSLPVGYWEVASDGGIFSFGGANFYGSMGGKYLAKPIVGMAATPDGQGYWEVASDGGVFTFGDAGFYGSMGGKPLAHPIVGMAATPDGKGYWLVASDGGVFTFGDAGFYGSMGGKPLAQPVVGIASTPDGQGYWLAAKDGGVFSFGDATFQGSMGGKTLAKPVVGIAASPSGQGYWLVASDGGIFTFGSASFQGSMGGKTLAKPVVGMTPTSDGQGYWEVASDGGIFTFGDASFFGSMGRMPLNKPVRGSSGV